MMSFRMRFWYSAILTVVVVSYIVYSTYNENVVQLYKFDQRHAELISDSKATTKLIHADDESEKVVENKSSENAERNEIVSEKTASKGGTDTPDKSSLEDMEPNTLIIQTISPKGDLDIKAKPSSGSSEPESIVIKNIAPSVDLDILVKSSPINEEPKSEVTQETRPETETDFQVKPSPEDIQSEPVNTKKILPRIEVDFSPNPKTVGLIRNLYTPGFTEAAPGLCPELGAKLKLLIMVTSATDHTSRRMAVRQTWGHFALRKDVAIAFCTGVTFNEEAASAIHQEVETYGDIVQGNFIDIYENMTLKTVSTLEWITTYCPHAKFILKTDDDMFINIPKLLEFTNSHKEAQQTIFGRLAVGWRPTRDVNSKYYVSTEQYPGMVLPNFTTGPAYLLTNDIIRKLLERALDTKYLKLEDVLITGIVAQTLNIRRESVHEFVNERIPFRVCNIKENISIHGIRENEQFDLWRKLIDRTINC